MLKNIDKKEQAYTKNTIYKYIIHFINKLNKNFIKYIKKKKKVIQQPSEGKSYYKYLFCIIIIANKISTHLQNLFDWSYDKFTILI